MRKIIFILAALFLFTLSTAAGAKVYSTVKKTIFLSAAPLDVATTQDGEWTFILMGGGRLAIYDKEDKLNDTVKVDPAADHLALSVTGDRILVTSARGKKMQEIQIDFVRKIDISGSPFLGPENATVTLVIFSDFQCPYCAKLDPELMSALDTFPNDLKIVYKNFPIRGHQFAIPAALAALAAGRQGKFWPFHDELFATAKLNLPAIVAIAGKLGLDMKKFNQDRQSPEIQTQLRKDFNDGRKIGVRGTPTMFVNGRRVRDRGIEALKKMIKSALEESRAERQ